MSRGALPNLIIVGVAKCGTSALHYYLDLHPQVAMSSPKELNFFIGDHDRGEELPGAHPAELAYLRKRKGNWHRGVDWYAGHFSEDHAVRGESSPWYSSLWHRGVIERMASVVPDARLIFMVRDPLERLVSQHRHLSANGHEPRDCEEALASPASMYLAGSRYGEQLQRFREHFPARRVLIVSQEELLESRRETLRRVFAFAGVDEDYWDPRMDRLRNRSAAFSRRQRVVWRMSKTAVGRRIVPRVPQEVKWWVERISSTPGRSGPIRAQIRPETRRRIASWLAEDLTRFRMLAGRDFRGWSITGT